jgi:hypothetical protein
MRFPRYSPQEIAARGREIYERKIRPLVEPDHIGKFLIIDIETGDYEIDEDDFAASQRAHARRPEGEFYRMKVGHRSSGTIGASARPSLAEPTIANQQWLHLQ